MRYYKFLAIGLALAMAAPVVAQEYRGRVQGVVADESGGALPAARVTLRNISTSIEVSRLTNAQGRYLFDYVDPGDYQLTVSMPGFKTAVQSSVLVQHRADITVDMKLEVGDFNETVTVAESPVAVQFNTGARDLTVEQKLVKELPLINRHPAHLAYLDPTVMNRGRKDEISPYHHWSGNDMDIGGGTYRRNDLLLDGTPLTAGPKVAYTPPMDAVTEFTVHQNAVDAEFGHTAGGVISMSMKSGSNDYRGSAYFVGRTPGLNATTNRVTQQHSDNLYALGGATLGMPLRRNKVFLFTAVERSEVTEVFPRSNTLPTALERAGDFSQSFNRDGSLRVIYDPLTTRVENGRIVRDPFPGNKIPAARWDPLASQMVQTLWTPNNPGDDLTGLNNYRYNFEKDFHYWNVSSRLDWQINEKWKAFGRISRFHTRQDAPDYTDGLDPLKMRFAEGSGRHGWNIAADSTYTLSPSSAFNVRAAYYQVEDKRDYPEMALTESDYSALWPSGWWSPYIGDRPILYFPEIGIRPNYALGAASSASPSFGAQSAWWHEPAGHSLHARFNKYLNNHSLKAGTEVRWKRGQAVRLIFNSFYFSGTPTANTYSSPDLTKSGHPWASFLLGAMDDDSNSRYTPMQKANTEMYALYVQDDFKVNKDLTLNLGLRWEWEGGLWDPENRLPRFIDLNDPVPGMQQAIDPRIPPDVKAKMAESAGLNSYRYNGAFHFTDDDNKRASKVPKNGFMPRIGVAYRLDEKTALRAGYGRFIVPTMLVDFERDTMGSLDLGAFTPVTNIPQSLEGRPQASLSDPFPQGLTPAYGKAYGRYTNLGDNGLFDAYDFRGPISDRINLSVQREVWGRTIVDVTYLRNRVHRDSFTRNHNLMDPRLRYKYGTSVVDARIDNPFYQYGTVDTFPGSLRRERQIRVSDLLKPYPQYRDLQESYVSGRSARYNSFQLRVQRPFRNGLSVLASYAYLTSERQEYYDVVDEYDEKWTWIESVDPRHRMNASVVWELPVGRDRRFGSTMTGVANTLLGNWQISATYKYETGQVLRFGAMVAPAVAPQKRGEVGRGVYWFDPAGFSRQPADTRRTNPWQYDGLTGPSFKNLDAVLSKRFAVSRRVRVEGRLEVYNALNSMNWANPSTDINSSSFGQILNQLDGYYGRQLQYTARIEF